VVLQRFVKRNFFGKNVSDILYGKIQLSQDFHCLERPEIFFRIFPVIICLVSRRVEQSLLFIKADILFGDSCPGFQFIDIQ
jgi:hypothetical protein